MLKIDKVNITGSKKSKKRTILFITFSIIVSLMILFAGFAYIYTITPNGEGNSLINTLKFIVKPGETAFQGEKTMNILCLGIDYNYDSRGMHYTKGARSDTMFVISLDSEARHVNMLSIPRDTWVNIPGYGYEKINSAYAIGGINLARKTVASFLGVEIDSYIIIKVKATKEVVDAIGGLELDVPKDMDYDDNWGNLHIHLRKGPQTLTGEQVVGFSRFRHDEEGDWGRMRRQQMVINALIREMKKPANLLRADKLIKIVMDNIETNLSYQQLLDLSRLYKDFDRQNMRTGVVKGSDAVSDYGSAIIIPDEALKKQLVSKLLLRVGEDLGTDLKVSIYNGSMTEGMALRLADALESIGYEVVKIGDAAKYDYEDSVIIRYIPENIHSAINDDLNLQVNASLVEKLSPIRNFLGFVSIKNSTDTPPHGEHISIIIGNKFQEWLKSHPLPQKPTTPPEQIPASGAYKSGSYDRTQDSTNSYTPPAPLPSEPQDNYTTQPDNQDDNGGDQESDSASPPETETPLTEELPPEEHSPPPEVTPVPKRYTVPIPPAPKNPEPLQEPTQQEPTQQETTLNNEGE